MRLGIGADADGVARLVVGQGPGRGAWVCPDGACSDLALARGALARALRAPVPERGRDRVPGGSAGSVQPPAG